MNRKYQSYVLCLGIFLCPLMSHLIAGDMSKAVQESGIKGGILVCLNGGDLSAWIKEESFLIHCLENDVEKVAQFRRTLQAEDLYGRISVAQFNEPYLPYADNTVNLLIADSLSDVSVDEAMRVLTPFGVLMVGGKKTVKPWPSQIDDWPQYLNKADNNAVAMDSVIGPPRRLQWSGDLRWARSHMAIPTTVSMVTGNGRMYSIEDRALTDNPFLPTEFSIVARDAFNGKKLWIHWINQWEAITMYIKCLPVQQQRRMAVAGDVLYCTFDLEGAVSAVDGATGKILKTYRETSPCQEVAYDQGILFLNVGDRFPSAAYNIVKTKGKPFGVSTPDEPFAGSGFRKGYDPEIQDKDNPQSKIIAIDPQTGKSLWSTDVLNTYTAASMSIKGNKLVYQTAEGLFCVHAKTGEPLWDIQKEIMNPLGHDSQTPGTVPNTVIITDDKVFAVEADSKASNKIASAPNNTVCAYALKDGRPLWKAPAKGNYEASSDVFYINGVLWVGGAGSPIAYDANTGEVIKKLAQQENGPMGHDRCYRNMITEKYFINSKTGGADFLDLDSGTEFPNHWTRGGCGMGVLPANGMLYSSPYSCTCSVGVMFPGLNAYASHPNLKQANDPIPVPQKVRLEKGPAYNRIGQTTTETKTDWPMYRYSPERGGVSNSDVTSKLKEKWQIKLTSPLSASISVGQHVYVCETDTHTLYAIDTEHGKTKWTFTASGRIDSPPTYHQGRLLFGSRDGWVYSVRAANGVLAWRFKDLPDRLIHVDGQLESTWPVSGSVLVIKDKLYFAAGRSSFLDGGIFLYKLDPTTGELLKRRDIYGPFEKKSGFPITAKGSVPNSGFRNDILVANEAGLFLRHRGFDLELNDLTESQPHIMSLGGFLDSHTQHRTGWIIARQFKWWHGGVMDSLIADDQHCYGVEGFPVYHNHSYFDPRRDSYKLISVPVETKLTGGAKQKKEKKKTRSVQSQELGWTTKIPITGKTMAKAGDVLFVAGEFMKPKDVSFKGYQAAYKGKLGGRLLAVSIKDGNILAEYPLDAAPVWDSLTVANGKVFICLADGTLHCFDSLH